MSRSSYFWCLCGRMAGALYESHVCGCLLQSRIVFDICARQICLGLVVFWDKKSTEARCTTKMWEGSQWGCLWLIFPLATWQGEDKALIMNCDTLMSLSGSDNTWSALLAFNLWYQWGKLLANKAYVSQGKKRTWLLKAVCWIGLGKLQDISLDTEPNKGSSFRMKVFLFGRDRCDHNSAPRKIPVYLKNLTREIS